MIPNSRRKIKILLLLTSTAGGPGLHAFYLAKYLNKNLFDVTVAFGTGYPLDAWFDNHGLRVHHVSMSRRLSPLTNAIGGIQLYRLMRRENFDIVLTQCSIAGFLGRITAKLAGISLTIFVIQLFASHEHQSPAKQRLYLWIEKSLDLLTDHYIAVSKCAKRQGIVNGIFTAQRASVIHNGIDLVAMDRSQGGNIRRELHLDDTIPIVGTIGRLEPQKGVEYFIRSAPMIRSAFPDARFLVVGDGPLRPQLEHCAKTLGLESVTIFMGWRGDISDILCAMNVLCLASLWEQFPFTLLEALAMKRPIVATRVDGVPEIIEDGCTGILVPPQNPEALAEGAIALLRDQDLARRLGETGRKKVEEHFTVERIIHQYEQLLRDLYVQQVRQ